MNKILQQVLILSTLIVCIAESANAGFVNSSQTFIPINTKIKDPIPPQEPGSIAESLRTKSYPYRIYNIPRTGYTIQLPPIQYNIYKVFTPTLANSVEIIGYVQSNAGIKMLFKTPDNNNVTVAYIGEKIVNGQVIFKRVITGKGKNPTFVLEEDGIEVVRAIGEKGLETQPKDPK